MLFRTQCKHCQSIHEIPHDSENKAVTCVHCRQTFCIHFPSIPIAAPTTPLIPVPILAEVMEDSPTPTTPPTDEPILDLQEEHIVDPKPPSRRRKPPIHARSPREESRTPHRHREREEDGAPDRGRLRRGIPTKPEEPNYTKQTVGVIVSVLVFVGIIALRFWLKDRNREDTPRPVVDNGQRFPNNPRIDPKLDKNPQWEKGVPDKKLIVIDKRPLVGVDKLRPLEKDPIPWDKLPPLDKIPFPEKLPPLQEKLVFEKLGIDKFPNLPVDKAPPALEPGPIKSEPIEVTVGLAVPITPPKMESNREEILLRERITETVVGGGGRFLIGKEMRSKSIAIFDVSEKRIVKRIPLVESPFQAKLAAGMESLILVDPAASQIQRWSLRTFEREAIANYPKNEIFDHVTIGSASFGPMMAINRSPVVGKSVTFWNIDTLKTYAVSIPGNAFPLGLEPRLWASADGSVFTVQPQVGQPGHILTLKDRQLTYQKPIGDTFFPSADGRRLFRLGSIANVSTNQLELDAKIVGKEGWFAPAVQGPWYLGLQTYPRSEALGIHFDDPRQPLVVADGVRNDLMLITQLTSSQLFGGTTSNIFLVPDARILALFNIQGDRIIFHRIDLTEAVQKSDQSICLGTTRVTKPAIRGERFTLDLAAMSKSGKVTFRKGTGPFGVQIEESGKLTWAVPRDHIENSATIVIEMTSGTAKATQELKIPVCDSNDPIVVRVKGEDRPWINLLPHAQSKEGRNGIDPSKFDGPSKTEKLDFAASDMVVGGGGRYLLFPLWTPKRLAIFDVVEAKVVKSIDLESNSVLVAAGRESFVVIDRFNSQLERWSLKTFEKELTAKLSADKTIAAVMGSDSLGPIVTATWNRPRPTAAVRFYHLDTLRADVETNLTHLVDPEPHCLRASANGKIFTCAETMIGKGFIHGMSRHPDGLIRTPGGNGPPGTPSPDGKIIYSTYGWSQFTSQLQAIGKQDTTWFGKCLLPSVHGPYYMAIDGGEQFGRTNIKNPAKITVHRQGTNQKIGELPAGIFTLEDRGPPNVIAIPADKCIHLIPDAKVVVVLDKDRDKVHLHRFDLEEAMTKAKLSTLQVISHPVTEATKEIAYVYPMRVRGNFDGISAKIGYGPRGMKLDEKGTITWQVPNNWLSVEEDVSIVLKDSSGTETRHEFTITIKK